MHNNAYVYCTECKYFKVKELAHNDYIPDCIYKKECCIMDSEDGKRFKERPKYEEK